MSDFFKNLCKVADEKVSVANKDIQKIGNPLDNIDLKIKDSKKIKDSEVSENVYFNLLSNAVGGGLDTDKKALEDLINKDKDLSEDFKDLAYLVINDEFQFSENARLLEEVLAKTSEDEARVIRQLFNSVYSRDTDLESEIEVTEAADSKKIISEVSSERIADNDAEEESDEFEDEDDEIEREDQMGEISDGLWENIKSGVKGFSQGWSNNRSAKWKKFLNSFDSEKAKGCASLKVIKDKIFQDKDVIEATRNAVAEFGKEIINSGDQSKLDNLFTTFAKYGLEDVKEVNVGGNKEIKKSLGQRISEGAEKLANDWFSESSEDDLVEKPKAKKTAKKKEETEEKPKSKKTTKKTDSNDVDIIDDIIQSVLKNEITDDLDNIKIKVVKKEEREDTDPVVGEDDDYLYIDEDKVNEISDSIKTMISAAVAKGIAPEKILSSIPGDKKVIGDAIFLEIVKNDKMKISDNIADEISESIEETLNQEIGDRSLLDVFTEALNAFAEGDDSLLRQFSEANSITEATDLLTGEGGEEPLDEVAEGEEGLDEFSEEPTDEPTDEGGEEPSDDDFNFDVNEISSEKTEDCLKVANLLLKGRLTQKLRDCIGGIFPAVNNIPVPEDENVVREPHECVDIIEVPMNRDEYMTAMEGDNQVEQATAQLAPFNCPQVSSFCQNEGSNTITLTTPDGQTINVVPIMGSTSPIEELLNDSNKAEWSKIISANFVRVRDCKRIAKAINRLDYLDNRYYKKHMSDTTWSIDK